MSSPFVALAQVMYIARHCIMGSSTFLIYDYVITIGQEVELFWTMQLTGASVLFFANRYITLLFNILGLAALAPFSSTQSCASFTRALGGVSYFQYVIWAAFSGLRAYALSRHRPLSAFVFLLMLVPAAVNYGVQFAFGLTGDNDPILRCISDTSMSRVLARKLVIVSRTCIITGDFILVVITWATLAGRLPLAEIARRRTRSRWTLSSVLLRDGMIYFIILLLLNVLHLAFTLSSVFGHLLSNISLFSNEVVGVLVSRFLLDLQAANRRTLKLNSDDPLNLTTSWANENERGPPGGRTTLNFARVIGSLGSSIDPDESSPSGSNGVFDFESDPIQTSSREDASCPHVSVFA